MATASQSLYNMTVASDVGELQYQGLLMPKLQYRFRVQFLGFGIGDSLELTKQVIDCNRPQVTFPDVTIPVYNSTIYLAGKYSWQPITINVRDDINNSVSLVVGEQIQKQLDFVEQASAATGQDYKFQTNIDILDGGNGAYGAGVIERWQLLGCFLQTANYNNLNYGTSDPVQIALTIRFDNALQVRGENDFTGVGIGAGGITTFTPGGSVTGLG